MTIFDTSRTLQYDKRLIVQLNGIKEYRLLDSKDQSVFLPNKGVVTVIGLIVVKERGRRIWYQECPVTLFATHFGRVNHPTLYPFL